MPRGRIPGFKTPEETKRKMSNAHLKNPTRYWLGKKFSNEHRNNIKKSSKHGKDSHLWKGGITDKNILIRMTSEYKIWRDKVFRRDNYTCQECGDKSIPGYRVKVQGHHIQSFAEFPELRFDVNNGQTLCIPCHKKTPNYQRKLKKN